FMNNLLSPGRSEHEDGQHEIIQVYCRPVIPTYGCMRLHAVPSRALACSRDVTGPCNGGVGGGKLIPNLKTGGCADTRGGGGSWGLVLKSRGRGVAGGFAVFGPRPPLRSHPRPPPRGRPPG